MVKIVPFLEPFPLNNRIEPGSITLGIKVIELSLLTIAVVAMLEPKKLSMVISFTFIPSVINTNANVSPTILYEKCLYTNINSMPEDIIELIKTLHAN